MCVGANYCQKKLQPYKLTEIDISLSIYRYIYLCIYATKKNIKCNACWTTQQIQKPRQSLTP